MAEQLRAVQRLHERAAIKRKERLAGTACLVEPSHRPLFPAAPFALDKNVVRPRCHPVEVGKKALHSSAFGRRIGTKPIVGGGRGHRASDSAAGCRTEEKGQRAIKLASARNGARNAHAPSEQKPRRRRRKTGKKCKLSRSGAHRQVLGPTTGRRTWTHGAARPTANCSQLCSSRASTTQVHPHARRFAGSATLGDPPRRGEAP